MKKIILVLIVTMLITGCKEEITLDLEQINKEITNLTTDKLVIQTIDPLEIGYNEGLIDIYDYDFKEMFNIDSAHITEYNVKYNEDNQEFLAIFKTDEDEVKSDIEQFLEDENIKEYEMINYEGYIIFVAAPNNEKALDGIKNNKELVLNGLMDLEGESLKQFLNINEEDLEEYIIKLPMINTNASTVIIVNPVDEKYDEVKNSIDTYMQDQEDMWSTYLPVQYEMFKNRKEEKLGEYLVYIVSSENDMIYEVITK